MILDPDPEQQATSSGRILVWDKALHVGPHRDGLEVRRTGTTPCRAKVGRCELSYEGAPYIVHDIMWEGCLLLGHYSLCRSACIQGSLYHVCEQVNRLCPGACPHKPCKDMTRAAGPGSCATPFTHQHARSACLYACTVNAVVAAYKCVQVIVTLDQQPEHVALPPPLASILGVTHETRPKVQLVRCHQPAWCRACDV